MAKKKMWTMIAGRGAPGAVNWGYDADVPLAVYEGWHKALQEHTGEMVAITGGGGYGVQFGRLVNSEIVPFLNTGKMGLRAIIKDVYDPDKTWWQDPHDFEPWVNSWQIWVGGVAPRMKKTKVSYAATASTRKSRKSSTAGIGSAR